MVVYIILAHTKNTSVPFRVFQSRARANRFLNRKARTATQWYSLAIMATED